MTFNANLQVFENCQIEILTKYKLNTNLKGKLDCNIRKKMARAY